ncbi:MAG: response regulator [Ignavibacteriaceae bacterium]|nr:response regulator [Ignavibacteriaceae bacterium]
MASQEKKLYETLFVEDNQENMEVISYFVKSICNVTPVSDGPSAIAAAKEKQFDLILMDINLGLGMNGMEATRQIRKLSGYESIPIIAVTAYAMVGDREIFLNAGCSHYISKPFTRAELLALIESVFAEQTQ